MLFYKKYRVSPVATSPQDDITILLEAVIEGNLNKATMIVQSNPELALDQSKNTIDFSGKFFKGLSPFQIAACTRDIDMLNMIVRIFRNKLRNGNCINFDAQLKMQHQFEEIYPRGDIFAADNIQAALAGELFNSMFPTIKDAIKNATMDEVLAELINPASPDRKSLLSMVLHNFRENFSQSSKSEIAFNPHYVEAAYKFYNYAYNDFSESQNYRESWIRGILFWRQVIGYIQRHMSIVYLQAFSTSLFLIIKKGYHIDRNALGIGQGFFNEQLELMVSIDEFSDSPIYSTLDNLGYMFAHSTVGIGDACVQGHSENAWKDVKTFNDKIREGLNNIYVDVSSPNSRVKRKTSFCSTM